MSNETNTDIITVFNSVIDVYNSLSKKIEGARDDSASLVFSDKEIEEEIAPLLIIDSQAKIILAVLKEITERAWEIEDSKILKACARLGLLKGEKNAKA